MSRDTIVIHFDHDAWLWPWVATFSSYDGPKSPIGTGATPVEAVEALLEMAGVEA